MTEPTTASTTTLTTIATSTSATTTTTTPTEPAALERPPLSVPHLWLQVAAIAQHCLRVSRPPADPALVPATSDEQYRRLMAPVVCPGDDPTGGSLR